jgi:hypothetical protein
MELSKIKCVICGHDAHIISATHLKKHGISVAEYKKLYPTAPSASEYFKHQLAERNRERNRELVGTTRSDKVKASIAATKKQKYASGETIPWNLGTARTEEQKQYQATTIKQQFAAGRVHHMLDHHHSEATKQKISASMSGNVVGELTKQKMRDSAAKRRNSGVTHPKAQHIPATVLDMLNSRDWLLEQHHVHKKSLTQIAKECGVDPSLIASRCGEYNVEIKRFPVSTNEREIVEFLESIGVAVETNIRTIISPHELDIFIPEFNVAIEHCGLYWHSSTHKHSHYHADKLAKCTNLGVRLITLFEDEWQFNSRVVKAKLAHILGKSDKLATAARKCCVDINVSAVEKKLFLQTNHIQGDGPGSINIGLRSDEGVLVALMCFVNKGSGVALLNRFATSCKVPGGFSKLLKAFITQHSSFSRIESFADLRWSTGDLYRNSGFNLATTIRPDYYWVKGLMREHKFNFRHARLSTRFENYDPELTEVENCNSNGWQQLYDCGKQKWVKVL